MVKLVVALICLLIGAFFALHGFTALNLTDTDPKGVYEVIQNGRPTGIFLTGKYVYTSGKALTAMVSVPLLLISLILIAEVITKRPASNARAAVVAGGVIALPICAIVLGNMLEVYNPWVVASVPLFITSICFFALRRRDSRGPDVIVLGK